jgi:hypothetical protein
MVVTTARWRDLDSKVETWQKNNGEMDKLRGHWVRQRRGEDIGFDREVLCFNNKLIFRIELRSKKLRRDGLKRTVKWGKKEETQIHRLLYFSIN